MIAIRHTSHARYDLWYHIVFGTKYRKKVWKETYTKNRVKIIFQTIAEEYDISIKEIEVLSDHVHMLASAPPRLAPARIVQILKSLSTKLLFEEFPWLKGSYWGGEIWIRGYFIRSVGDPVTRAQIVKYIKEQAEEL